MFFLLKSTPHSLHSQILGCFLDLAENQKTLSHIEVWRGKDNVSAPHLLCELWREEERRLGVIRDEHGAIAGSIGSNKWGHMSELIKIFLPIIVQCLVGL